MIEIIQRKALTQTQQDELEVFLHSHPEANFYHQWQFAQFIESYFKYPEYSCVALQNGRVVGYMPLWHQKKQLLSMPWRDRGAPVFSEPEILPLFWQRAMETASSEGIKGVRWQACPFAEVANSKRVQVGICVSNDLTQLEVNDYPSALPRRVRRSYRTAIKNGCVFEVGTREFLPDFYQLFVRNRQKLGVPVYPIDFFETLLNYFSEQSIVIFRVTKDKEILASMFALLGFGRIIMGYNGSSDYGNSLKANDFMISCVLQWGVQQGMKCFDFGTDSLHQQSLIDYKLNWGGERADVYDQCFGQMSIVDWDSNKIKVAREIFKRMPESVFKLTSRILVK